MRLKIIKVLYTPIRMVKIKRLTMPNVGEELRLDKLEPHTLLV